jgi:hypothetical protein
MVLVKNRVALIQKQADGFALKICKNWNLPVF